MQRLFFLGMIPAVVLGLLLVVRFRPKSVARFNRAVTNRITRRFAGWMPGFGIVIHRGRGSGRLYRTPINLFRTPDGFLIALTYGRDSEWVKNVQAAGGGALETRGRRYRLSSPTIVHDPRHHRVPRLVGVLVRIGGVTDYLQVSAREGPAGRPAAEQARM